MATGAESISVLAEAIGGAISLPTLSRHARLLRESGHDLWPEAPRGGSRLPHHHVEKHHLANLLISVAAWQPVDAPETVLALRELPMVSNTLIASDPKIPDGLFGEFTDLRRGEKVTLGDYIKILIDETSYPEFRQRVASHFVGWELELCARPEVGEVRHRSGPKSEMRCLFQSAQLALPFNEGSDLPRPSRRTAIINYDVILAAGRLWEDTQKRRAEVSQESFLAQAVPNAGARTENARAAIPTAARASLGYPLEGDAQAAS